MHIYIWMDGWVSAYPHGWMPPAGHAGIRRGRRPCACRCKCPRRRRAALRCRQGRARAGQLVTSGASRVRLGVSRPGVGPWRAPANWSPPVPASVSLGQRLSMARALACRRPACPRGSRQLVTLPPACAPPPPPPPRPPRPPRPPFVALARATLCSPRGRAPTGPPAPLNRLPSTGTLARAAGGPSPTHTHRPRPAHHRARKRSRVRTSFRGEAHLRRQTARRPCGHVPQPTGHCPSSPGGGGARVPAAISAGQLARVHGGGDPEGTGRHRCPPASPEKGVWAPLQAPGAAGPVDGRCLPTNLAKDRADAQRLVATRLLDRLHDPLGHFSRLQRIHPRAR